MADPTSGTGYYKPADSGSDSLYSPFGSFLSYSLDTLQMEENFHTGDFNENLREVLRHLRDPKRAIDDEGGFGRFVNREIFPFDGEHRNDQPAMLPNYGLHLLGGGIAYRKDLEWFSAHGYRYPQLYAVLLAMTGEVIQEAFENENTTDADAIADTYLFRPLGIWLFNNDRFAAYFQRKFEPAVWPSLQGYDVSSERVINAGISYVYRPTGLQFDTGRLFIYTGLNNLFGMSHATKTGGTFSWGVGAAVKEIIRQRDIQADVEPSLGFFYDRNDSLLWSVILNDAGNTRFRMNFYPRGKDGIARYGFFLTANDDSEVSFGLSYRFPFGLGATLNK